MADGGPECRLEGLPASPGFAIGPAFRLAGTKAAPIRGAVDRGRGALVQALQDAALALNRLREKQDDLAADILEFQVALIEDEDFIDPVHRRIEGGEPADVAWRTVLDGEIADYQAADDDYMAARAQDLVDLRDRVLRGLSGRAEEDGEVPDGAILVAAALTPSGFLERDWQKLKGAALEDGSPTSHVAILARARGVPMIVGLDGSGVATGETLILDAGVGTLTVNPSEPTLEQATKQLGRLSAEAARAEAILNEPAITKDGHTIGTLINVDDPSILDQLDPACCDGIGLARTEFLFHRGRLPNEDEQAAVYEKLVLWASGRPVTIRTVDAGGDKPVPGLTLETESNPFLGVRGLRLSLMKPAIFETQLRALARAAALGPLKVMLPMITAPSELSRAREHLDAAMDDLAARSLPARRPALGIMVETPAAALMAEGFDADFYSIGSNDLIQYVTASARDEPALGHLADPRSPAVLELIARTVDAAERRGVEVSLCGDMASTPELVPTLLAQGLRRLSVAPAQLGPVKLAIAKAQCSEPAPRP